MIVFLLLSLATAGNPGGGSACNHQHQWYHANREPLSVSRASFLAAPIFSPFDATNMLTALLESAKTSIDIGTPHWKSWIECADGYNAGCDPKVLRNETDPFWAATLNAIHRGVKVRMVTNDCDTKPDAGLIDTYRFLALAGAEIKYYTGTSFYHEKYLAIDSQHAVISSINLSKSSMTDNREAGLWLQPQNDAGKQIVGFWASVFEEDFDSGIEWPVKRSDYTDAQLRVIDDTSHLHVAQYMPDLPCAWHPPVYPPTNITVDATTFTHPDWAEVTVSKALGRAQSSIQVYMYSINADAQCDDLYDAFKRGVNVTLLVSSSVVGNMENAFKCYSRLVKAGLSVRKTQENCLDFWHQKFWIIDGETLWLSTGNWDKTDLPLVHDFPPKGSSDAVNANRGLSVAIHGVSSLLSQFTNLLEEDWKRGEPWKAI